MPSGGCSSHVRLEPLTLVMSPSQICPADIVSASRLTKLLQSTVRQARHRIARVFRNMWQNTSTGYPCNGDRRRRLQSPDTENEEESRLKRRRTSSQRGEVATSTIVNLPLRPHLGVLALPSIGDDLVQLHAKLIAIANVVRSGESIAQATGYRATPMQNGDSVAAAIGEMTPAEHQLWVAFHKRSIRLPDVDWSNVEEPAPTSPKSLKVARRRAEALNRLYETDQAREGHVVWFTQHHIAHLPLVKAMARVIGAEINQSGGHCLLNTTQFADLQTINRILAESSKIIEGNRSNVLLKQVVMAQEVLVAERRKIQAVIKLPINLAKK